jgi:hypothetical protein
MKGILSNRQPPSYLIVGAARSLLPLDSAAIQIKTCI